MGERGNGAPKSLVDDEWVCVGVCVCECVCGLVDRSGLDPPAWGALHPFYSPREIGGLDTKRVESKKGKD